MAIIMNKIYLSCNLAKDPVIKTVGDNMLVSGMYVAHDDRIGKPHFFAVEAWDKAAQSSRQLKKGSPVIIEGYVAQDRWKDESGNNRQVVKIVGRHLHFVNRQVHINNVVVSCNVATEPSFKDIGSGDDAKKVMDMRIACDGRKDASYFFSVEAWNGLARSCETLAKGSRIIVDGRLAQDSWRDDSGKSCSVIKIVANDIHFVNRPRNQGKNDGARHFD